MALWVMVASESFSWFFYCLSDLQFSFFKKFGNTAFNNTVLYPEKKKNKQQNTVLKNKVEITFPHDLELQLSSWPYNINIFVNFMLEYVAFHFHMQH